LTNKSFEDAVNEDILLFEQSEKLMSYHIKGKKTFAKSTT